MMHHKNPKFKKKKKNRRANLKKEKDQNNKLRTQNL